MTIIQKTFDKMLEGLVPEEETALLAVSGGVDSICMAELFVRSRWNGRIAVAHCNFHLRGEESDSDEALVRSWAESHGAVFHSVDFDTERYAAVHSQSIEMAARELRYDWFASLCREHGYYAVAVAHNANDNAETLMLNLLRGTGLRGISGMRPVSEVPVSDRRVGGVRLIRPLLPFTRAQIVEYAREYGLEWHEDRTNAESVYKRNKIRNLVFPVFESINPSFLDTLSRDMAVFSQENAIADGYFEEVRARVCLERPREGECLRVDAAALRREKHWEYVLYRLLEPFGFKSGSLEPLAALMRSGGTFSGRKFNVQGYRILTSGDFIIVKENAAPVRARLHVLPEIAENDVCMTVEGEGLYTFGGRTMRVSLEPVTGDAAAEARLKASSGAIVADASALPFPFLMRGWRHGDWMRPFGMRGRKKLSDIFSDMKLSLDEKDSAVVFVRPSADENGNAGEHVAAVCGNASGKFCCRADEALRASSGTSMLLCIRTV